MLKWACILALGAMPLAAQDTNYGVSVPVTVSGGAMYSERLQLRDPNASAYAAGFRVMMYPTIKLGSHWFGYAAVQVRSMPYFYYDAFLPDRGVEADTIQAYLGYETHFGKSALVIKAGRMVSAFGSFPMRYDDVQNPVIDQPLLYITEIPVRADQLVCNTEDQLRQFYGSVGASCGGAAGRGPGLTPATLYGLNGIEAELSSHRVDARVQMTGRSTATPDAGGSLLQQAQWTAGGGYSIRQGFRTGISVFRGPYMDRSLAPLLPAGTTVRDFPASGFGIDQTWARGRWSVNGEWQRLRFETPNFVVPPSITAAYVEAKGTLTPRFYLAGRAGWLNTRRIVDRSGVAAENFGATLTSVEAAAGVWVNRHQLLKLSYSILHSPGGGSRFNVLGFQFVTTVKAFERAFR